MTLADRCETEVVELHAFFEDWFTGRLDRTGENVERAAAVLPDEFEMVTPDGEVHAGPAVRANVEAGHGSRADADPAFEIEVRNVDARYSLDDACLLTYEEHQRVDGAWTGRRSTALFGNRPGTPNGVAWLHLQETSLPA